MHKLALLLASITMKYDDYKGKRLEVYVYGFEIIMGKMITYLILLSIGIILNYLIEIFTFASFVILLRGYTGGYHLKNSLRCILGTVVLCLLSIFVARNMNMDLASKVLPILLIISSIYIWYFSPINHPNLRLTKQEKNKCIFFSRVTLIVEILATITMIIMHVKLNIIILACLAIIFVFVFMLIAKIIKQEVLDNE